MPGPAASPLVRLRDSAGADAALADASGDARRHWLDAFRAVRAETERRAAPLGPEDQVVQSMPDASPTKWHRAHVTWFFEQFLLRPFAPAYRPFDERFAYLFNSYYVAAGPRHARPQRGLITRPGVAETTAYRAHVDDAVAALIESTQDIEAVIPIVEIGLNHEQQHQELMLTDILHAFAQNATNPVYDAALALAAKRERAHHSRSRIRRQRPDRRHSCDRPRRPRLLLRQRAAGASGLAAAGLRGAGAGEQRRVARIHGRRRLYDAESLAVGRMDRGAGARLERAGLLAPYRRRLVRDDARRAAPGRSGIAGVPRQLLRSRRVCALGRQASAERGRMGGRGQKRRARRCLRRRSGNGRAAPTRLIPVIGPRPVRSANTTASSWSTRWCCAARRWRRRPAIRGRPIAISFIRRRAGSSADCVWPSSNAERSQ